MIPQESIIEIDGNVYSILNDGIDTKMLFLYTNNVPNIQAHEGLDFMIRIGVNPLKEPTRKEIDYIMEVFEYINEI